VPIRYPQNSGRVFSDGDFEGLDDLSDGVDDGVLAGAGHDEPDRVAVGVDHGGPGVPGFGEGCPGGEGGFGAVLVVEPGFVFDLDGEVGAGDEAVAVFGGGAVLGDEVVDGGVARSREVPARVSARYGVAMCAMAVEGGAPEGGAPGRMVALLRGVNVGGNNMVAMATLRELLQRLGYGDVRTHLQSGNAVFSAPGTPPAGAAGEIEERLARDLGLNVRVIVRTGEELARVIESNPLPEAVGEPSRLLVNFLSAAPDGKLVGELDPADFEPDVFGVGEREVYVWCPEGVRATKLSYAFWEKRLGVAATARNWNTVTRLRELVEA
jgi:uncharacterized protein (DUF1697 family)